MHATRRDRAARCLVGAFALLSIAAQRSAEQVLANEPREVLERLERDGLVVLEDVSAKSRDSFIVAFVLFDQPRERVVALLRQAERQTEYRPELESVQTVRRFDGGRIDEQRLRILFTEVAYRLRYREELERGRFEWSLDPDFDNDLRRFEGFWELSPFAQAPGRTLARFGSSLDVGPAIPAFVQKRLSRGTVLRYLRNCRAWINADGDWRP